MKERRALKTAQAGNPEFRKLPCGREALILRPGVAPGRGRASTSAWAHIGGFGKLRRLGNVRHDHCGGQDRRR
jgi:hypothetical protein